MIDKTAVLIPAYNASSTLGDLLERLKATVPARSIFVIDDGSADQTGAIAREEGANVVRLESNSGKGAALSKGFELLKNDTSFEFVATLDADLQHPPERLGAFVEEIQGSNADIVIGHRSKIGTKMPFHRRLSNTLTSFLVSVRTGQRMLDSQCGFRLIRRQVLSKIQLVSHGFEAETEFLLRAAKQNFKVSFVPIETIYNGERSHMTNWKTTVNFIRVLLQGY